MENKARRRQKHSGANFRSVQHRGAISRERCTTRSVQHRGASSSLMLSPAFPLELGLACGFSLRSHVQISDYSTLAGTCITSYLYPGEKCSPKSTDRVGLHTPSTRRILRKRRQRKRIRQEDGGMQKQYSRRSLLEEIFYNSWTFGIFLLDEIGFSKIDYKRVQHPGK